MDGSILFFVFGFYDPRVVRRPTSLPRCRGLSLAARPTRNGDLRFGHATSARVTRPHCRSELLSVTLSIEVSSVNIKQRVAGWGADPVTHQKERPDQEVRTLRTHGVTS